MRGKNAARPVRGLLIRGLALVAMLLLIGGSILLPAGQNQTVFPWLPGANAETGGFKTLKKGSSGAEVRKAQQALAEWGYYQGRQDGNFSRVFEEAVIAFQLDFGLDATGRIDEETYLLITDGLTETAAPSPAPKEETLFVQEAESYSDKEHVAAYLRAFGHLPRNYITKRKAEDMGWQNRLGNLWDVAPGKSIGGDRFGNYDGQLPEAKGRKYYECDIDFNGRYRNAKRIIFSNDGLIFYTEDHYNTFEELTEW